MPYAHIKKKIPINLDRRVKYSEAKKQEVKTLFKIERLSQREISRRTGISRRMVCFILFPDKLLVVRKQYKERRKDGRYYSREKHRLTMRKHRNYKQSIKDKLV